MENIHEIAELLNELMQKKADNTSVKFFHADNKWYYMSEDEYIFESSEDHILEEVQAQWDDFLVDIAHKTTAESAWGKLIDDFTDHEETVMERCLMDNMTSEQRADAYLQYINGEFHDEKSKLEVMVQY